MDVDSIIQVIGGFLRHVRMLVEECRLSSVQADLGQSKRLSKLVPVFAPVLTAVIFYHYLKYLLIFNAYQYERFVRNRCGYVKKLSKQLRHLTRHYSRLYFCYMPMDHGTTLPPTYSLFMAIKEVLVNSNRPSTRVLRTNLLLDLVRGDRGDVENSDLKRMNLREENLFGLTPNELDPLFEYNLDIMKCSRELIIQGIKDFDVMTTVYRVMESVMGDGE